MGLGALKARGEVVQGIALDKHLVEPQAPETWQDPFGVRPELTVFQTEDTYSADARGRFQVLGPQVAQAEFPRIEETDVVEEMNIVMRVGIAVSQLWKQRLPSSGRSLLLSPAIGEQPRREHM